MFFMLEVIIVIIATLVAIISGHIFSLDVIKDILIINPLILLLLLLIF